VVEGVVAEAVADVDAWTGAWNTYEVRPLRSILLFLSASFSASALQLSQMRPAGVARRFSRAASSAAGRVGLLTSA
jgi:hypothetical protein